MKFNFLFICFFVIIFSSVSVFAINPHTQVFAGSLDIVQPETSIFKVDNDIILFYHVVNSSGHILDNSEFNCYAYVYNGVEQHILFSNLTNDEVYNKDVMLVINKSLLFKEGIYSISLWCNDSVGEEGFINDYFYLTRDGVDSPVDYVLVVVVGLIGFIIIFLIISFNISETQWVLRSILLFFSIFLTVLIPRFLYALYPTTLTSDLVKYDMRIIYLLFIYFVIYFLFKVFDYYGKFDGIKRWIDDNFKNKNRRE